MIRYMANEGVPVIRSALPFAGAFELGFFIIADKLASAPRKEINLKTLSIYYFYPLILYAEKICNYIR